LSKSYTKNETLTISQIKGFTKVFYLNVGFAMNAGACILHASAFFKGVFAWI